MTSVTLVADGTTHFLRDYVLLGALTLFIALALGLAARKIWRRWRVRE
jgi:hypothetical protein